ncbi:MAG: hypothetical protein IPM45_12990 [Acidimicrobiales bacterium]|nr:hypothetical protein [Acidimicrobiales bacterium]
MRPKLGPGSIVLLAAGALTVIASFLPWLGWGKFRDAGVDIDDFTAWSRGMFPLTTLVAVYGVLAIVEVLMSTFGTRPLAPRLGMGEVPLRLFLSVPALVMMLAFWFVDREVTGTGLSPSKGVGFWLSLLGTIGMVAGAVLTRNDLKGSAWAAGGASGYRPASPTFGAPLPPPPVGTAPVTGVAPSPSPGPVPVPAPAPAPAGATDQPFWFYVDAPEPLVSSGDGKDVIATLQPGDWFLAKRAEGGWVLATLDSGSEGWVDATKVRRQG